MNNKFLFNCYQASALADRFHDHQLSMMEKWKIKIHLKVCKSCKNYYLQSRLLNEELSRFISVLHANQNLKLPDEKKQAMESAIIKELGD